MSAFASPTSEDEMRVMEVWWGKNCKPFSEWFLKRSDADRLALLRKGCPDIPAISAATRSARGESLKATDMLLPELSEDALMEVGGRICVLFITRRMSAGLCIPSDVKMLQDLSKINQLPLFNTGSVVKSMDTPFVDPCDEENVQCLTAESSAETRAVIIAGIESGRLASIEVWMAVKVRRTAIAKFLRVLFEDFEVQCDDAVRPSPTLAQLIVGEMKMQAVDAELVARPAETSMDALS